MTSEIKRGRRLPFVVLPWAVLDDPTLSAHDVLVYSTLARFADHDTGQAWPSRATIAELARCDVKTVDRCLTHLVEAGFIEKTKRRNDLGETNLYVIHEIAAAAEARGGRDSNGATPRDSNGATPRDSNGARTRTTLTREARRPETQPAPLPEPDPSEWTLPPDEELAKIKATLKGKAAA
jgi:hypothetical protein